MSSFSHKAQYIISIVNQVLKKNKIYLYKHSICIVRNEKNIHGCIIYKHFNFNFLQKANRNLFNNTLSIHRAIFHKDK